MGKEEKEREGQKKGERRGKPGKTHWDRFIFEIVVVYEINTVILRKLLRFHNNSTTNSSHKFVTTPSQAAGRETKQRMGHRGWIESERAKERERERERGGTSPQRSLYNDE